MARTDMEQLQYSMEVRIDKLIKSNERALAVVNGSANKIERRYQKLAKVDLGGFLDRTWNSTRLATFNAGAARIPIFGDAIEALGPAGMVAAAGLAALAVATTQTLAAMRFADEIDDTATKLNIGTDALQEYRFAMTEVGGTAKDADTALEGFQKKLGEGIAGGRAVKWFERLGFGQEDLKAFGSTEEALAAVMDKIAALGRESERAAVAEKLGLGPMVALAREGAAGMEALRRKAQDMGYVMDAELIKKGADANQKFETMAHIIDVQMKSAFVGLSDEILTVTQGLADALKALNNFLDRFGQGDARMKAMLGVTSSDMMGIVEDPWKAPGLLWRAGRNVATGRAGRAAGGIAGVQQGHLDAVDSSPIDRGALADLASGTGRHAPPGTGGSELLNTGGGGGKSRSGPSAEELAARRAQIERTLAIEIARLENNHDLVRSLEAEDGLARRIKELDDAGLTADEARIQATTDLARLDQARADHAAQQLSLQHAQADIEAARAEGDFAAALNIERRVRLEARALEINQLGYDIDTARAYALEEQVDLDRSRAVLQARIISDAALEHQITLARLSGDEARLRVLERSAEITNRARALEASGNLNYGAGVDQATREVDEEIAAQSRAGFKDGVRGLIEELRTGGVEGVLQRIFDNVLDNMADQLAEILTQMLFQPGGAGGGFLGGIGAALAGGAGSFLSGARANGGPVLAGHSYLVGEKRAEVFTPSVNGHIAARVPAVQAVGRGIVQHITFDNRGAIMMDEVLRQQQAHATQTAGQAGVAAVQASRRIIPAEQGRRARFRLA